MQKKSNIKTLFIILIIGLFFGSALTPLHSQTYSQDEINQWVQYLRNKQIFLKSATRQDPYQGVRRADLLKVVVEIYQSIDTIERKANNNEAAISRIQREVEKASSTTIQTELDTINARLVALNSVLETMQEDKADIVQLINNYNAINKDISELKKKTPPSTPTTLSIPEKENAVIRKNTIIAIACAGLAGLATILSAAR